MTRNRTLLLAATVVVALAVLGCSATGLTPNALTTLGSAGDEASPFGNRPAVRNLDPDLRAAVQAAARDARADGVRIEITSGWRSRAHQQRLLNEAVGKYGSLDEALRFVATPDTSAHVTGDAVDIGPTEADDWLSQHGSDYGLCQIFANEIWHYELATTPGEPCPAMYPDSSSRG